MGFQDAVRSCLKKYVTFSGRAPRSEFWWFILASFLASIVAGILDSILWRGEADTLSSLLSLALLLPTLAVAWRRMHDIGKPGWYSLMPYVVTLAALLFMLSGAMGAGLMHRGGMPGDVLAGPVFAFGSLAMIVFIVAALISVLLVLWWFTRPSQPGSNSYGPNPLEVNQ